MATSAEPLPFKQHPAPFLARLASGVRPKTAPLMEGRLQRAPRERSFGTVNVLVRSKEEALATMALYAPCSSGAVRFQSVVAGLVKLLGTRAMLGRSRSWDPPMDRETWDAILGRLSDVTGGFDGYAPFEHSRAPNERLGLLLLSDSVPSAFVKLRAAGTGMISREARALRAIGESRVVASFVAPSLVGEGQIGSWRYIATTAVLDGVHKPALDVEIQKIERDIQHALASVPRPGGIPADWVPIHGDLTPWNLRRTREGSVVLVDWEESGWGPPGADRLRYDVTVAESQGLAYRVQPGDDQLIEYWAERGRVGW